MRQSFKIRVIGKIWWPMGATCATDLTEWTETPPDDWQTWIDTHASDFSEVIDFQVETGECRHDWRVVRPWSSEESEMIYWDCMDPMPESEYV